MRIARNKIRFDWIINQLIAEGKCGYQKPGYNRWKNYCPICRHNKTLCPRHGRFLMAAQQEHDYFETVLTEQNFTFHKTCKLKGMGTGFIIQRFCLSVFRRPIDKAFFEERTQKYTGPYIPLFCSRYAETADDKTINPPLVPFYAIVPQFILNESWPIELDWLWSPPVQVDYRFLLELIRKEHDGDGWRKNLRGQPYIPKRTGVKDVLRIEETSQEWSDCGGKRPPSVSLSD